jgi:hypothetical protein
LAKGLLGSASIRAATIAALICSSIGPAFSRRRTCRSCWVKSCSRARPSLAKSFIHLRHDPDRALIFGIDFERLEELSPGMRPARRVLVNTVKATEFVSRSVALYGELDSQILSSGVQGAQMPSAREGFAAGTNVSRVKRRGAGVPCVQVPSRDLPSALTNTFHDPCTDGTAKLSDLPSY